LLHRVQEAEKKIPGKTAQSKSRKELFVCPQQKKLKKWAGTQWKEKKIQGRRFEKKTAAKGGLHEINRQK